MFPKFLRRRWSLQQSQCRMNTLLGSQSLHRGADCGNRLLLCSFSYMCIIFIGNFRFRSKNGKQDSLGDSRLSTEAGKVVRNVENVTFNGAENENRKPSFSFYGREPLPKVPNRSSGLLATHQYRLSYCRHSFPVHSSDCILPHFWDKHINPFSMSALHAVRQTIPEQAEWIPPCRF